MGLFDIFETSIEGLVANKFRSFLTMLGVIIGVVSVILLVSIALGVKSEITGSIANLGSNLYIVMQGNKNRIGSARIGVNRLKRKHAQLISKENSYKVIPSPTVSKVSAVKAGSLISKSTLITGCEPNFSLVRNWEPERGRFLKKNDVDSERKVCVIGKTIEKELFPNQSPLNKFIRITGKKFTIVGIMEPKGQLFDMDNDNQVFIPITTAQRIFGINKVSFIFIKVPDARNINPAIKKTEEILSSHINPEDFMVRSQGETLSVFEKITSILTIMLGAIATISLIVGGIGIMNIMTVSVTERTREIGIRKALGAKDRDILLQFLTEAVLISLIGGIIGIFFAYIGAFFISKANTIFNFEISFFAVACAFLFSFFMGTFFGVYPAYKAASLDPIEALRYE
ncbi:MAG: ABC transporter permease [Thermodesulfobacteriota bacterium]|nr:ABC transporter permease [Thermodesulfobacteriota bacterium]